MGLRRQRAPREQSLLRNYLLYICGSALDYDQHGERTDCDNTCGIELALTGKVHLIVVIMAGAHYQSCRYHSTCPRCQINPSRLRFIQHDVQEGQWGRLSAGTVGKGSSVRCARDRLSMDPCRVPLYTSPHPSCCFQSRHCSARSPSVRLSSNPFLLLLLFVALWITQTTS